VDVDHDDWRVFRVRRRNVAIVGTEVLKHQFDHFTGVGDRLLSRIAASVSVWERRHNDVVAAFLFRFKDRAISQIGLAHIRVFGTLLPPSAPGAGLAARASVRMASCTNYLISCIKQCITLLYSVFIRS